jgi:hypothetical protein
MACKGDKEMAVVKWYFFFNRHITKIQKILLRGTASPTLAYFLELNILVVGPPENKGILINYKLALLCFFQFNIPVL